MATEHDAPDALEEPAATVDHDPNRLASFLQAKIEDEKFELTRELHDNLGGLLVGALMDAAWAEGHLDKPDEARAKLLRVRHSLSAAIDLKRKLIEDLRPTLLDNVGLHAALAWHLKNRCAAAGLLPRQKLGVEEPSLEPEVAITLFRFFQEALELIVSSGSASFVEIGIDSTATEVSLWVDHDGRVIAELADARSAESESMRHRILSLGGRLSPRPANAATSGVLATVPAGAPAVAPG